MVTTLPKLTFDELFRFWSHIDRKINVDNSFDYSQCWICDLPCPGDNHPQVILRKKLYLVTRIMYWLHYNVDPGNLQVQQKPGICVSKRCVNPTHYKLGNQADNMKDKISDGTSLKNNKHSAKIDQEIANKMKRKNPEMSQQAIADCFNISRATVSNILSNKTWKGDK